MTIGPHEGDDHVAAMERLREDQILEDLRERREQVHALKRATICKECSQVMDEYTTENGLKVFICVDCQREVIR